MTTIPITEWRVETFAVHLTQDDFREHRITEIELEVCRSFGVSCPRALHERTRRLAVAWPRQVAIFLIRRATQMSLQAIAEHFGLADHKAAMHAVKAVRDRMATCRYETARINLLCDGLGISRLRVKQAEC